MPIGDLLTCREPGALLAERPASDALASERGSELLRGPLPLAAPEAGSDKEAVDVVPAARDVRGKERLPTPSKSTQRSSIRGQRSAQEESRKLSTSLK